MEEKEGLEWKLKILVDSKVKVWREGMEREIEIERIQVMWRSLWLMKEVGDCLVKVVVEELG
jgi:ABC-type transport system involved in cytochrome c biogenesis ATPase subunit